MIQLPVHAYFIQKNNHLKLFILFSLLVFLTPSCQNSSATIGLKHIDAEEISVIKIPIQAPIKDIENRLNEALQKGEFIHQDTVFKQGKKTKILHTKVSVSKNGSITLTAKNDYLHARIPIYVTLGLKYGLRKHLVKKRKPIEVAAQLIVYARTPLTFNTDWQLLTATEIVHYEWITTPQLDIFKREIDAQKIAEKQIDKLLPRLMPKIDKKIKEAINIQKPLQKAWIAIQQQQRLEDNPEIWFKAMPQAVLVSPLKAENDTLKLSLGLKIFAETIFGEPPVESINPKLPPLQVLPNINHSFAINLVGTASYEQLTEIAAKELIGFSQQFMNERYKVRVTAIEIYPEGQRLVAKLEVTGSVKGCLYLKGMPQYDPIQQHLYLDNFDFSLKTNNLLAHFADLFKHRSIKNMLAEKLVFSLEDQIDEAVCKLQEFIGERPIGNNVVLEGNLVELIPKDIELTPDFLKAVVLAKGTAELNILAENIATNQSSKLLLMP